MLLKLILSVFLPFHATGFLVSQSKIRPFFARDNVKIMAISDAAAKSSYNKVFVAGGTRGLGRLIVDRLLEQGSEVVVLCRNEDSVTKLSSLEGCTAIKGDAIDYKSVENAMDGCDAVITTLGRGGSPTEDTSKIVDYDGNSNVIEAAGILGVTRLLFVTSIGCGNSREAVPPNVFEILKDALVAKERAENVLIKFYTNMNWTIVRPGGLKNEPATNTAILTEDNLAIGSVHREDVANLVIKALTSGNTEKKILSCIDPQLSAVNPEGKSLQEFSLA